VQGCQQSVRCLSTLTQHGCRGFQQTNNLAYIPPDTIRVTIDCLHLWLGFVDRDRHPDCPVIAILTPPLAPEGQSDCRCRSDPAGLAEFAISEPPEIIHDIVPIIIPGITHGLISVIMPRWPYTRPLHQKSADLSIN
jgi:hypothetical protein